MSTPAERANRSFEIVFPGCESPMPFDGNESPEFCEEYSRKNFEIAFSNPLHPITDVYLDLDECLEDFNRKYPLD